MKMKIWINVISQRVIDNIQTQQIRKFGAPKSYEKNITDDTVTLNLKTFQHRT